MLRFFNKMGIKANFPSKLAGVESKCISADCANKKSCPACAQGRDRLVEAFPARPETEITNDRLARLGEMFGIEREVLIKTANDNYRVLHSGRR